MKASNLHPFEFVVAAILVVVAFFAIPWSFNNWNAHLDHDSILGISRISEQKINDVLCSAKSPACGSGYAMYHEGLSKDIKADFALSIFKEGSLYGEMPCKAASACINYDGKSWPSSYATWYDTVKTQYIAHNVTTATAVVAAMSPDNEPAYLADVNASMTAWSA